MITVLSGGTGGAKFVQGLGAIVPGEELTVIVNTGDDLRWWGLHISPDLDSITYALAGVLSRERGWGYEGDSFRCLERMRQLGAAAWFQLGDLDLATHLRRTELLNEGKALSEATAEIARAMGIRAHILPMSDSPVATRVRTAGGELCFQEYFVRERFRPAVLDVRFEGAEHALTPPGLLQSILQADAVMIAPSNPVTSIGPILAVPGVRDALRCTTAPVTAVSPIVGGAAVSGPAGDMMRMHGLAVSCTGMPQVYGDFVDLVIADEQDQGLASEFARMNMAVRFTNTIMRTPQDRIALARFAMEAVQQITANSASH